MHKFFQARHIVERLLQSGPVLFRRARPLQQRLQRRLQDRHRRLQLVSGIGQKFALLGERTMQSVEHGSHGLRERREFSRVHGRFAGIRASSLRC